MKMTMYDEYGSREQLSRRAEEKVRLLHELTAFLEENNPPLLSDLIERIKPLITHNYVPISELIDIINSKIYPSKIIQETSLPVVVTSFSQVINNLKMIDARNISINSEKTTEEARIDIDGLEVSLLVGDSKYLLHSLSTESQPYKILSYLMNNANKKLRFQTVKLESDSVNYNYSPSEFARQIGFDKPLLKKLFFPIRVKNFIEFRKSVALNQEQVIQLINVLKP